MNPFKDMMYRCAAIGRPHNAASVLTYHSISHARHFGTVTPENFARQMQALKDGGFNVVSLDRLAGMRKAGVIAPRTVALTFDDGYRDNFTEAFPVLKRHAFPATIFVITDAIGGSWSTRGETFEMLSENDIRELSQSGLISIEPHTVSHPKLPEADRQRIELEIRESKARLESLTGASCTHFAYPFGKYNKEAQDIARGAGIRCAYTAEEGLVRPQTDDLSLYRNGINRTVTLPQFIGTATWGRLSRARFAHVL